MQTTVDGVRMHYRETGSGEPAVLLLHGVPVSSHLWRNVLPRVAPAARTVAIDFVGMGESDKPLDRRYDLPSFGCFLDAAVKALGLDQFVLVGMDLGLIVGLHWAMANEARLRGLVLMEGFIAPVAAQLATFPAINRLFMRLMRARFLAGKALVRDAKAVDTFVKSGLAKPIAEEDLAVYREAFKDPELRRRIWLDGIGPHQLRPRSRAPGDLVDLIDAYAAKLQASSLPKLLLKGEPGAAITAPMVAWAREHLKNLEVLSVGAGKHFLPEDQPAAVGEAIGGFVKKLGHQSSKNTSPMRSGSNAAGSGRGGCP